MSIPSVATAAVLRGAMGVLLAPDFLSTKHTAVEGGSAAGPSHMRHCGAGLISWPEWRRGGLRSKASHIGCEGSLRCRVGPRNFTPSLSQVGSKTGAPV